jgi:aldose 1-epimerase
MIPTGEIETVVGTPFDFRNAATLGSRINDHSMQLKNGKGYDHNFVLNKHAARTPVARVKGDISGIVMEVFTDQPGLQLYSGNFMEGKNILKWSAKDEYRTAFAMETQHFPDSPNKPSFPSTELRPGQSYKSSTCYKFCI